MPDESIICPKCGAKIPLSQALTRSIEEKHRRKISAEYKAEYEAKIAKMRAEFEKEANKKAQESVAAKLKDLRSELREKEKLLEKASKTELEFRKRQRLLEEKKKNIELEIARGIDKERESIEAAAIQRVTEAHRLKDREKEKIIADMKAQIDELKRKAEQGSQQIHGEIQELELEDILRRKFPSDEITPVGKGIKGADVLQTVYAYAGRSCGSILWESKRTKSWNDAWIEKIKDDQSEAKANIAVIVSAALPKDINRFDSIKGIWVTDLQCASALAVALRENLIGLSQMQTALAGKNEKMEVLYEYLSGPQFKQRVQALVETFMMMKEDLDGEKRAVERLWAKREKQLDRILKNASGMYGDLQGIIGASLENLNILELPAADYKQPSDDDLSF